MSDGTGGTVEAHVVRIGDATRRFAASVEGLAPADLAGPSLLPGWTRGHVVAHVARNAFALANVLRTAAGGEPTPMYPSMEARNAAIEEGAVRPLDVLLEEVTAGAAAYAEAARAVPEAALDAEVEWIGGRLRPARAALPARLREVELHHVDLAAGYTPAHWDPDFVAGELDAAAEALSGRDGVPEVLLVASDAEPAVPGRLPGPPPARRIAGTGEVVTVTGPAAALLAWVSGRSGGDGLQATGGVLPDLPAWP